MPSIAALLRFDNPVSPFRFTRKRPEKERFSAMQVSPYVLHNINSPSFPKILLANVLLQLWNYLHLLCMRRRRSGNKPRRPLQNSARFNLYLESPTSVQVPPSSSQNFSRGTRSSVYFQALFQDSGRDPEGFTGMRRCPQTDSAKILQIQSKSATRPRRAPNFPDNKFKSQRPRIQARKRWRHAIACICI